MVLRQTSSRITTMIRFVKEGEVCGAKELRLSDYNVNPGLSQYTVCTAVM